MKPFITLAVSAAVAALTPALPARVGHFGGGRPTQMGRGGGFHGESHAGGFGQAGRAGEFHGAQAGAIDRHFGAGWGGAAGGHWGGAAAGHWNGAAAAGHYGNWYGGYSAPMWGAGAAAAAGGALGLALGAAAAAPAPVAAPSPAYVPVYSPPAAGTVVTVLPGACASIPTGNGGVVYNCGGTYYQPFYEGMSLMYQVVPAP